MTLQRSAAQTAAQLYTLIRMHLRDPATHATGQAIADANRRFQDAQILLELQQTLIALGHEAQITNAEHALQIITGIAYTVGGLALDTTLGVGVGDLIYSVEKEVDTGYWKPVRYLSSLEMDRRLSPLAYTLTSITPSGTSGHPSVSLRMFPDEAQTLRLHVIRTPTVLTASTDTHGLSARWPELIALGVARRLLAPDEGSWQPGQETLYRECLEAIRALQTRHGPRRIRRTRA